MTGVGHGIREYFIQEGGQYYGVRKPDIVMMKETKDCWQAVHARETGHAGINQMHRPKSILAYKAKCTLYYSISSEHEKMSES